MSDLRTNQRAVTEQAYHDRAQRTVRELELASRRKAGQGEFLGDMVAAFGQSTQGGVRGTLFAILPMFNLFLIAGWLIYILATAS